MRRITRWISVVLGLVLTASVLAFTPVLAQTGGDDGGEVTCDGLAATIVGTDGADVLEGTFRDDVIVGLGGNDIIRGASGNDTICGGDGADIIDGQSGADTIFGEAGNDQIRGGSGDDVIDGGDGDDFLEGNAQNDTIHGGDGDDDINGGSDNDALDGGNGVDVLDGLWQTDTCDDGETTIRCETITNNGEPDDTDPVDTDGDGIPDGEDSDLDGDGTVNEDDAFPSDATEDTDTDGDGVGNNADPDDDGDGIEDSVDPEPLSPSDLDGDGIPDSLDDDIDGDGVPNDEDPSPSGLEQFDFLLSSPPAAGVVTPGIVSLEVSVAEDSTLSFLRATVNGVPGGAVNIGQIENLAIDLTGLEGTVIVVVEGLDASESVVSSEARLLTVLSGDVDPPISNVATLELPTGEIPFSFNVRAGFEGVELDIESPGGLFPFDIAIERPLSAPVASPVVSEVVDLQQDPLAPDFLSAALTLEYDEAQIEASPEADLRIYTFNEDQAQWEIVSGEQTVDSGLNTVTVNLEHFSCYAVFEGAPGADVADCVLPDSDLDSSEFDRILETDGDTVLTQSVLVQPEQFGSTPALDQRFFFVRRSENTVEVQQVSFTDALPYEIGTDNLSTAAGCDFVCAFLDQNISQSEIRSDYIRPGRSSQGIFQDDNAFLRGNFVRDQLGIECLLRSQQLNNDVGLGECFRNISVSNGTSEHFDNDSGPLSNLPGARLNDFSLNFSYEEWRPDNVELLYSELSTNDGAFGYRSSPAIFYKGKAETNFIGQVNGITLTPNSVADSVAAGRLASEVVNNWGVVTSQAGAEEFSFAQLFQLDRASFPVALQTALDEAEPRLDRFVSEDYEWNENFYTGRRLDILSLRDFVNQAVKTGAFEGDEAGARALLEIFPLVTEDENGTRLPYAEQLIRFENDEDEVPTRTSLIDIREYTGFERGLVTLLSDALQDVAPNDFTKEHELISRLPETNSGIRNGLITGYYFELGNAIQTWANGEDDPRDRPAAWGTVAQWASANVRDALTDDTFFLIDLLVDAGDILGLAEPEAVRQAVADANQWIFNDAGLHYARLLEFVDGNPNPTIEQWESYFSPDHVEIPSTLLEGTDDGTGNGTARFDWQWSTHDRVAREGVVALAASRYAADRSDQQALMFVHTVSFGDVEQQGAQRFLQVLTDNTLDVIPGLFINTRLGSVTVNVDQPLQNSYLEAREVELSDLEADQTDGDFSGPWFGPQIGRNHDPEFWALPLVCEGVLPPDYNPGGECAEWPTFTDSQKADFLQQSGLPITFSREEPGLNLEQIGTYPTSAFHDSYYVTDWSDFRRSSISGRQSGATDFVYASTNNRSWNTYPERMWTILNLFRTSLMDPRTQGPALDFEGDGQTFFEGNRDQVRDEVLQDYSSELIDQLLITPRITEIDRTTLLEPPVDVVGTATSTVSRGDQAGAFFTATANGDQTDVHVGVLLPRGSFDVTSSPTRCQLIAVDVFDCSLGDLVDGETIELNFFFDISGNFPASEDIRFGGSTGQPLFDQELTVDLVLNAASIGALLRGTPERTTCQSPCIATTYSHPNLVSFDGSRYIFHGAGDYVLVESTTDDFQLQARFSRMNSNRVSLNRGMAATVGDSVIAFGDDPALQVFDPIDVRLDGEVLDLSNGAVPLPGGAEVAFMNGRYRVTWPDGTILEVGRRVGDAWTFELGEPRFGEVIGMLGNANGDRTDDLVARDGAAFNYANDELYTIFGASWLLDETTTLFESELDPDNRLPIIPGGVITLADLPAASIAFGEAACRLGGVREGAGLAECIFDVALTGDVRWIESFVLIDQLLLDSISVQASLATMIEDDVVATVPGTLAGSIDNELSTDAYRFNLDAGSTIFIDGGVECPSDFGFEFTLEAPSGFFVGTSRGSGCGELGLYGLPETGEYTLRVYDSAGFTGGYSLEVSLPEPIEGRIELDEVVTETISEFGEGNHVFSIAEPTQVYLDFQQCHSTGEPDYQLIDPSGAVAQTGRCEDRNLGTLAPGDWTLRVVSDGTSGTYSFQLWDVQINFFDAEIDEIISGELSTPLARDEFRFVVPEGSDGRFFLDINACDRFGSNITLFAPDGSTPISARNCESRALTLGQPGVWTLRFSAESAGSAYNFEIMDLP